MEILVAIVIVTFLISKGESKPTRGRKLSKEVHPAFTIFMGLL